MNEPREESEKSLIMYVTDFIDRLRSDPAYTHQTKIAYHNDLNASGDFLNQSKGKRASLSDFNMEQAIDVLNAEWQNGHMEKSQRSWAWCDQAINKLIIRR